jgi:hypothetical protein
VSVSFNDAYGINGQFSNWLLGQSAPDGWTRYGGAVLDPVKETTIYRSGPNAMRWDITTAADAYVSRNVSLTAPAPANAFVEGTVDAYVIANTSGGTPGLLLRMYTDAAETQSVDRFVAIDKTLIGNWQRVPFKASPGAGAKIYRIDFFAIPSWTGNPGGQWRGQIVYDSLVPDLVMPSDTLQLAANAAAETYEVNSLSSGTDAYGYGPLGIAVLARRYTPSIDCDVLVSAVFDASGGVFEGTRYAFAFVDPWADVTYTGGGAADWSDGALLGGSAVWGQPAAVNSTRTKCSVVKKFSLLAGVDYLIGLATRNGVPATTGLTFYGQRYLSIEVKKR